LQPYQEVVVPQDGDVNDDGAEEIEYVEVDEDDMEEEEVEEIEVDEDENQNQASKVPATTRNFGFSNQPTFKIN